MNYAASLPCPSPTRAARDAAMNSSRSPSSTLCGSRAFDVGADRSFVF
jgi:hypothetical protein